jgi:NAD(P)-dependent dehydrogenase (short-subunit alcohol dehydrogenase family)
LAFGHLDVIVNNAGYANLAAIEDVTLADFREQVDANLFGVVNVTKAALPVLREQGGGHVIQVSSIGGRLATAGLSAYQAAKWAVGGFSEVLAREVGPLGIKVTVLEPGGMQTDWAGSSMRVPPISEPYQPTVGDGQDASRARERGRPRRPCQGGPGRPGGRRDGRAATAADPRQRGLFVRDGRGPDPCRVRHRMA